MDWTKIFFGENEKTFNFQSTIDRLIMLRNRDSYRDHPVTIP